MEALSDTVPGKKKNHLTGVLSNYRHRSLQLKSQLGINSSLLHAGTVDASLLTEEPSDVGSRW